MKRIMLITVLLIGCATTQDDPMAEARARNQAVIDQCRQQLQSSAFDPIRQKVASLRGLQQPTLEMLSDSSFATDEQRPAILALDAAAVACSQERGKVAVQYYGSDYAAVEASALSDSQSNRLNLYQGKITWGQYSIRGKEIANEARGMFAALDQRRRQSGIQQQAANAQSVGAAAALMQATPIQPITLQPPPPLPRPVNCTSIRQGAYTTTNCR